MENKEHLLLIDKYLSNQMTAEELNEFNNQLANNPDLSALLKEYETTLTTLNRNWINKSWKAAARKLIFIKAAAVLLVAVTLTAVGGLIYKSNTKNNTISETSASIEASTNPQNSISDSKKDTLLIQKTNSLEPIPKRDKFVCRGNQKQNPKSNNNSSLATTFTTSDVEPQEDLDSSTLTLVAMGTTTVSAQGISKSILEEYNSLKNQYQNPEKNAQTFTISNSLDTVISGAKGIRVAIPSNTFVDSNQNEVTKPITLKLTEFVDAFDMFENGISTNFAEGALSSGGSCYIMAYEGKQKLQIAKDKTIEIEFPTAYHPEMETYYGSNTDTGVIWNKAAKPSYVYYTTNKPDPNESKLEIDIVKNDARGMFLDAPRYDRSSRFYFNLKAVQDGKKDEKVNPMLTDSISYQKAYTYFNAFKLFDKRLAYEMFQDYERNLEGDTLRIHYKINADGEIYKYNVEPTKKKKQSRKLKRFAKKQGRKTIIPNWNTEEYSFTLELVPAVNYTVQEQSKLKVDSMLKDHFQLNQVLTQRKNRINIRTLGLANCDRRTRDPYVKPVMFNSASDIGHMYIYIRGDNALYRRGLNTTLMLKPMQSIDIIAIKPTPSGLQMSLRKNVRAKKYIEIDQEFEPFDKKKVEKALR